MLITFHRLFSLGLILLMVYLGGSLLFSFALSPKEKDWLVDSRYVELTVDKYKPGSITHFDLRAMSPPRNSGFFLLVGSENNFAAVFDRPGCLLEHKPDAAALFNPCQQRFYPIAGILAGDYNDELKLLPVTVQSGLIRIDISSTLDGNVAR